MNSNILLVVDVQPEYKDKAPEVYDKILSYINQNRFKYDKIVAFRFINSIDSMFVKHLGYLDLMDVMPLDFKADEIFTNSCYGLKGLFVHESDTVTIIGFDSDACVLSAAYSLWDSHVDFKILTDYIASTGGKEYHDAALLIAKRNFGDCVVWVRNKDLLPMLR